ncbi:ATP-binding protein [Nonomuraea soli]|uniref:Anti-sigma regulatory factor (Ser/Thr protein kinase) n=1 Tax=Nonomuraea soli TaxID=1032476 RepID=A0A7W0HPG1_9ACTN|nr:ATP-binding protein [Nonomuraea soli]MBA2890722.1 anti-sigma regulatory factor (Ser/Thr protein kinase) [Nonomuraea soli]
MKLGPGAEPLGLVSAGVTLAQLTDVRELAAATAYQLGMRADAVPDVLIAINEIATNAVTHGRAPARVRIWRESSDLVVEVRDAGHWPGAARAELPSDLPPETVPGGRGLWIARAVARTLAVDTDRSGTRVTLRFALN